jgi:NAD(P)H-hydrate epimerase
MRLGADVRVVLAARAADLAGDAAGSLARARQDGVPIDEAADERAWEGVDLGAGRETIVVDALLGTGVTGGARGVVARAVEAINSSGATVVAVDLPSGVDADTGILPGVSVRAHRTYTLCRPKACLVLEPAASHAGSWRTIDIGIPAEAVAAESAALTWFDAAEAVRLLPYRPADAHKGTMGHLLVVAGSRGKSGAAVLVGRAALRSGAGLVTVATPRSVQGMVAAGAAELMTEPLRDSRRGGLVREAVSEVRSLLSGRDALAIGPGVGTDAGTRAAVVAILAKPGVACVVDADALNALAERRGRSWPARRGEPAIVLTPHPGEAARLLASTATAVQADRLGAARRLATSMGTVVVLKGRRSIVAHPDGRASFNATGNPGMATGGTGDALTGIVGALLARGLTAFDAARLGTYLHGAAGDRAAEALGPEGMIAGDLIEQLPAAWRELADHRRGTERWTHGA